MKTSNQDRVQQISGQEGRMQKVALEVKLGKREMFPFPIEILFFLPGSTGFDKWDKGISHEELII